VTLGHPNSAAGLGLAVTFSVLLTAIVASLAIGAERLPFGDVVEALTSSRDTDARAVVMDLRVPRTALGLLAGLALGGAGVLLQGITRNALAEPGILGINGGAAFAVVIAITALGVTGTAAFLPFALIGAVATALAVFLLGGAGRRDSSPERLALAGAVLAALLVSATSAVLVFDVQTLDELRFWLVGALSGRDLDVALTVLPLVAAGVLVALLSGRALNGLAMGETVARSLGQRVGLTRAICGGAAAVLAAAAVAAVGPIAFVGLVVPHIAREIAGGDYRWIVPYSLLLGPILLLGADVAGRLIARPEELEVGVVTALVGAPFFIWLVRRRKMVEL
jgi:iron complex transport system permease protein